MLSILLVIISVAIDQTSKYCAILFLKHQPPVILIDNFLKLNYVENRGAAWGIFQDQRTFFIISTLIVLIAVISYIKMSKNISKAMRISLYLIIGGAIGNLIDRIRFGYVVDFIDVTFGKLYDFPVFNFADSFIVIGTIIMIYLVATEKN